MARLTLAAAFGVIVGIVAGAAFGVRASGDQDIDESELEQAAAEANVDVVDLRAAALATSLAPRQYLIAVGEIATPARPPDSLDRLVSCLEWFESRGDPGAVNPRSGAAGPLQFLLGTWLSTPQGRAGLSRFDPAAARAAARWMVSVGRLHEWSTWRLCA
jgi:hypothetical protein